MRIHSRVIVLAIAVSFFACPLLAPSLQAGDSGTVKGTFTVAGKRFTPDHVYAVLTPGNFDKKTKDVLVIFTVKPREKDSILLFGNGGPGGTDLTVMLGQGFKPGLTVISFTCRVLDASLGKFDSYSKGGPNSAVFEKKTFDPRNKGRVAGKIRFSEEPLAGKEVLTSDIEFDVPILGEKR